MESSSLQLAASNLAFTDAMLLRSNGPSGDGSQYYDRLKTKLCKHACNLQYLSDQALTKQYSSVDHNSDDNIIM